MPRLPFVAAAALSLLIARPVLSPAAPRELPDSTAADQWRLENGLEVVTRHVPGAAGVAVTLAFRAGTAFDPPKQAGLADLVADLAYYGPAPGIPARTPEEMPGLRPKGWGVQTSWRHAVFTEIVTPEQVPGVLQQAAARLQATPDAIALRESARRVTAAYARRHFADPELVAWYRLGEVARGVTDEQMVERASGRALAALKPRDVAAARARLLAPANGVLSLAGDLSAWDVRALVRAAFGDLPAGERLDPAGDPMLSGAGRVSPLAGLTASRAAVGLFAPSLDDTLHASFFLGAMLVGSAFNQQFATAPGGRSHFSYSLYEDPDVLRLFPEVAPEVRSLEAMDAVYETAIAAVREQVAGREILDDVRRNLEWFLGGPLRRDLLERLRREPGGLGTLASGAAIRSLWRGESFWERYRLRFMAAAEDHTYWLDRLGQPGRRARLLMVAPR